MRYQLPFQGKWHVFTDAGLLDMHKRGEAAKAEQLKHLWDEYQKNRISFFLAHSGGIEFINEYNMPLSVLNAGNQLGKELDNEEPVQTPSGEVPIGQLKVGDLVYAADGRAYPVSGVYPQGTKPVFKMTFDDGTSIRCGREHLWKYLRHKRAFLDTSEIGSKRYREFNQWEVLTTEQIIKLQGYNSTPQTRGYIPLTEPVQYPDREHVIPPYVLGVLLGDGCLRHHAVTYTNQDQWIINKVSALWPHHKRVKIKEPRCPAYRLSKIVEELRHLGLMDALSQHKFIPDEYLYDSITNRLELLRGLMDTDGSVSRGPTGHHTEIAITAPVMARNIVWLFQSLGGKVKMKTKNGWYPLPDGARKYCSKVYRISVMRSVFNPFSLPRKAEVFRKTIRRFGRLVYSIEPDGEAPCTCISVDSPDHTFLARNFIVTHNTLHLLAWLCLRVLKVDPDWPCFKSGNLVVPPVTWQPSQRVCLASYRWKHVKNNLWRKLAELLPMDELKEYSPQWNPRLMGSRRKTPNFSGGMPSVQLYESDAIIDLAAYEQGQVAFESYTWNKFAGDEQIPEGHWRAVRARGLTAQNFQAALAFTLHAIPEQPGTGPGSWLDKLMRGNDPSGLVKGRDFQVYHINTWDVPDAILSDKEKKKWYDECIVQPEKRGDLRALSEGKARFFGISDSVETRVYEKWNTAIQLIPRFPVPFEWARMRAFDPGDTSSAWAGLWAAFSPWGDLVLYNCFYRRGLGMQRTVEEIVQMSQNRLVDAGTWKDSSGVAYPVRHEDQCGERYDFSVMDPRTFACPSKETTATLGDMYAMMGLACVPASGMHNRNALPICREWLEPIPGRKHLLERMGIVPKWLDQNGKEPAGTPLLYVFSDMVEFVSEIDGYITQPGTGDPAPNQRDHLMTALKYLLLQLPRVAPQAREVKNWRTRSGSEKRRTLATDFNRQLDRLVERLDAEKSGWTTAGSVCYRDGQRLGEFR